MKFLPIKLSEQNLKKHLRQENEGNSYSNSLQEEE